MYSPGTIKAIGLMSRGVSADRAFAQADQIDLQAAQVRVNYYTEQSLNYPSGYMAPSTSMPAPSATPSAATPNATAQTPAKVSAPLPSTQVVKTFDDMLKQGYKRNTGDGSYLNFPKTATPGGPNELVTPSTKKVKPFFDRKFIATPQEELDIELGRANHPLKNLSPELYKLIPELSTTQWGVTDPSKLVDLASTAIAKELVKSKGKTEVTSAVTPEQLKEQAQIEDLSYQSLKKSVTAFIKPVNIDELIASKKILESQINSQLGKNAGESDFTESQLNPQRDNALIAGNINTRSGDIAVANAVSKANAQQARLLKLKSFVNESYKDQVFELASDQIVKNIKDGALASSNLDQYLKSLDGYKNAGGGLGASLGDYSQLIKQANLGQYLDRKLTEADIQLGGPQVLNEQALAKYNEKKPLSIGENLGETRYDETKQHLIEAHLKIGQKVVSKLQSDNLALYKKREDILKAIQSPELSEKEFKKLESEAKKIENQVDLNNKLAGKAFEIHDAKTLKTNKDYSSFGIDAFMSNQEAMLAESEYHNKASWVLKPFLALQKTAQYGASGAAKLVTTVLEGVGGMTGWDGLETFGRYSSNYLTPHDLVNFDVVTNKGQYLTNRDIFALDKEGGVIFQPSALLYSGAEVAPLVIATVYGGSLLTSAGGRLVAASRGSLVSRGLMSAKRANDFGRALATTRNYGTAYQTVLAESANPIVRAMASNVPYSASLGAIIYPQEFARAYKGMYEKGIENAKGKAHAIAAVSTSIEMATELMFSEMKYLTEFAEKGVGISNFAKKYGPKWMGNIDQYRALYGDIFGKAFTPSTLEKLAVFSANKLGTTGAAARFMLARGVEEGREEVAAELLSYFADNHMGLAAMQGEAPREFSVTDLVNAFAGGLVGPPIGLGNQIKQYKENKQYGQYFDIMLNSQFYKNKVTEAVKSGEMKQDTAVEVLTKIQELDAIEKEYGVRNLKNFQSIKGIKTIDDLMEDPYLQFDYFKNVLKKKSIDEKIQKLDTSKYTEEEKNALIAEAEEVSKTIADYKSRSDFYSGLSTQDKQQILDDNINRKVQLSRMAKTETLEQLGQQVEDLTIQSVNKKKSEGFLTSVRGYRDSIEKIRKEREEAEQNAITSGTYNPLVDHLENQAPSTELSDIKTQEDLEDALVQALLAPDRGKDLVGFVYNLFDEQLDTIEQDKERIVKAFLESAGKSTLKEDTVTTNEDGTTEVTPEARDDFDMDAAISDLTEEQQDELGEMLAELDNQYDDLVDRKNAVGDMMSTVLTNVAPKELLNIQDPEAREKAQTEWIQSIYENASDTFEALKLSMETDPELSQDVFYDRVSFAEYREQNKDKVSKVADKNKKTREERKKAAEEGNVEDERGTVSSTEISPETGKPVEVISPELLPGDVTPEFAESLEALSEMPESRVVTTESEVEAELITAQEYNKQRGELLGALLGEVLSSPSLEAAQAKLRAVMEAAGSTPTEINDTLALLTKVANNEIVYEEEYTHMFDMLLIKANMDLDNLKFQPRVVEVIEEIPPVVAPVEDKRTPEEIERTTVLPNVQLGTLKGKLVEYNGVRGVLQISEGGIVTVETDSVIYELENATATSSTLDYMIQEVTTELDSKEDDNIISENEVVLDGVEYLIETDSRGTVVGLRDKKKPQKRITKNKLLIRAEVLRNRLEHQVITEAIEETPELVEAIAEAVQSLPSAQVVENLFNFNMTENVASAIDKLFEEGNNLNLNEAELLEAELWIMDTWYKLDDLVKEYPGDEIYQNALENLLIINKLLYNGKQAKSGRKVTPQKSTQEKETRVAPRKAESKSTSKSAISRESAKPKQLNLFTDQPRLSAEELAQRDAVERQQAQDYATQRIIDQEEAMADEQLYSEYLADRQAFRDLDLPPEGEALQEMRISRDSFVQFSDKANLQGNEGRAIIFGYIGKPGEGFGVDQVAQRASDIAGREITTADIIDFILSYPGGIGGPTSKSTSTYFGKSNPDVDPRYSGIQSLIKQRQKENRARARKESKKKTIETPMSPFDADFNVSSTLLNNQTSSLETNPVAPKTEEQVAQVENKTEIMSTSALFIPRESTSPDARHFGIQERIVKSINEEHRTANTGIVDLFTVIEQVLGESTLTQMETIFNEVQSNPSSERRAELRSQFIGLFPAGFMKQTALEYMFDTQMVKNISQVDVNQKIARNLNASQTEIYEVNKGRAIKEVTLKDGRKIKNLVVRQSQGKLLLLKQTPLFDAEGNAKLDENGKPMTESDWYTYESIANPESILAFPIIMGTEAIGFKDLNTLTFTALDSEGKVQKYNDDGSKTATGNKALITYLPTSKAKANPTPQEVATNGLRKVVAGGSRVSKGVKLTGPTFIEREEVNGVSRNKSYKFEFSTEELTLQEVMLSATEVKEAEVVTKVVTNQDSQQKSIDALNKLVAKAKSIPDPDKKGYVIDGSTHERQSNFTKRTLGNASMDAPDLDNPESAESTELMELGAAVGNLLDIVGRDVLGGRTVKSRKEYIKEAEEMALNSKLNGGKGYKLTLTDEQFNSLVGELTEFKKELNRKGYQLFTEGLVVYRKFTEAERAATGSIGLAGAMDIVAIDAEGGVHIIDFKNKKFKNQEKFKNSLYTSTERYPSNISKWGSQQTTYAILSEDFDLPVRSINIYAFASQYEVNNGVITIDMLTKASDKVPVLSQNRSDISDSVIKLTYDRKVMKQLELRTVNPKAANPVEVTEKDIDKIKENNQEFTDSEAKNAYLILSSLNIVSENTKDLDAQDQQPDTQNPPDCNIK